MVPINGFAGPFEIPPRFCLFAVKTLEKTLLCFLKFCFLEFYRFGLMRFVYGGLGFVAIFVVAFINKKTQFWTSSTGG